MLNAAHGLNVAVCLYRLKMFGKQFMDHNNKWKQQQKVSTQSDSSSQAFGFEYVLPTDRRRRYSDQ